MERLIAKRPVLYQGRQYEQGEALPAHDPVMVDAWRRAGSAELVSDAPAEETEEKTEDDAKATDDGTKATDDGTMVEGRLDPAQLESMSKEELVALAKEAGVELPRGAAKALIVERLATATFQAPANDGSAQ